MTKEQIIALLGGSPLTPSQDTNFKTYLSVAYDKIEELLCTPVKQDVSATRYYTPRGGFRTVYTDLFTEIEQVKVNDVVLLNFYPALNGDRNAKVFNSIVLPQRLSSCDIEITADWGFDCPPKDLQQVIAQLFSLASQKFTASQDVKSKKVEDFSITFGDKTKLQKIIDDNSSTIDKYSQCGTKINVKSGNSHFVQNPEFPPRQNDFISNRW